MAASHEYLGSLTGGRVRQYADLIGQIYYVDPVANTRSYAVPNGFEDRPGVSDIYLSCRLAVTYEFISLTNG